MSPKLNIDRERIAEYCAKWRIEEFAFFGSVLRDDFSPESDVDVLITFAPDIPWSLYDWVDMIEELQGILGRKVDLLEQSGLRNPYCRRAILDSREVYYAA
jgi:uncharacterized protein